MLALLIGVNLYRYSPEDSLRGCITDSNNLWILLNDKMEYPGKQIVQFHDSKARADDLKAAMLSLVTRGNAPPAHLVISHSSHGTNNPDPTQKDGLQELLCCYDTRDDSAGLWDTKTVLSAKFLGELFAKVRPIDTLDFLVDCCHAPEGSQLKIMGRRYDKARFMPRSVQGRRVKPSGAMIPKTTMPHNVALWSASEPHQTSADAYIDGTFQGAFTAAFLKAWRPERTRADIIAGARAWLTMKRFNQRCHLYCGKEMALRPFGG